MENPAFTIMGLVFMAVGLANKDKWKQNHRTWKQLGKDERRRMAIIIVVLGLLVLAGLTAYFLFDKGIL